MTAVVLGSFSGSPGVTAVAMGLGGSIGGSLVIEADCSGGRLAARWALRRDPGVLSWAATRGSSSPAEHVQQVASGVSVVVGSESGSTATSAWRSSGPQLVASLGRTDRTVIVDAGRLGGSPVLAAFRGSPAQWLVVVRNDSGELTVAAAGLRSLDTDLGVRLVMIGSGPHPAGEVEAVLGAPVAAVLPLDAAAADAAGAGRPHRDLRSTPWARAVRSLAASLLAADIRDAAAGVA